MTCTVIVPTYNRVNHLKRTVDSLLRQDHEELEIIVVNDGSTDGTYSYLESQSKRPYIQVIHQKNRGPAEARNAGIRAARGEIIAFTDDDCVVPPDWVRRLVRVFEDPDIGFAGGTALNMTTHNFLSQISQEITNHFVGFYGAHGQDTSFLTSNNIAYRSRVLRRTGGFDTCFRRPGGEERALNIRLLSTGIRGVLIPDLTIKHHHVLNLRRYFRQQRNYGRGSFIIFHIICPLLHIPPQPVSTASYLSLVKSWLQANPFRGVIKTIVFMAAQSQNLTGYLLEALAQFPGKKR
jgi:glycosyltransferase involved in cell wall biosynthesis